MSIKTYCDKRQIHFATETSLGLFLSNERPEYGAEDTVHAMITLPDFDAELTWWGITGRAGLVLTTGTDKDLAAFRSACRNAITNTTKQ